MEKVLAQLVAFYRLSFGAFLRILQVKLETLKHGVTYLVLVPRDTGLVFSENHK